MCEKDQERSDSLFWVLFVVVAIGVAVFEIIVRLVWWLFNHSIT